MPSRKEYIEMSRIWIKAILGASAMLTAVAFIVWFWLGFSFEGLIQQIYLFLFAFALAVAGALFAMRTKISIDL